MPITKSDIKNNKGKVLNKNTGRFVKRDGEIGKRIIELQRKQKNSSYYGMCDENRLSRMKKCDGKKDAVTMQRIKKDQGVCLNKRCFDASTIIKLKKPEDPFSRKSISKPELKYAKNIIKANTFHDAVYESDDDDDTRYVSTRSKRRVVDHFRTTYTYEKLVIKIIKKYPNVIDGRYELSDSDLERFSTNTIRLLSVIVLPNEIILECYDAEDGHNIVKYNYEIDDDGFLYTY